MKNRSLMNLINTSPFGYAYHKVIFDSEKNPIDYYFIEVNKAFEKLTGLKAEKIINKKITEVFPEIKKSKFDWIRHYGKLASNGGYYEFDQYQEHLHRWYKVHVNSDKKGYFSTLFIDITEQKKMEIMLKRESERLEILSSTVPVIMCEKDINYMYKFVNKRFYDMVAIDDQNLEGKSDYDFFDIDSANNQRKDDEFIMNTGRSIIDKSEVLNPKYGTSIWVKTTKSPVYDIEGNIDGIVCISIDITQSKREEEELLKAKKSAESANRAKSEFLANMSHEIRTPLNAVIGFTDLLGKTYLDRIQKQYLENIDISGKSLLGVINDILDFSKIEAGKLEFNVLETDVALLAEQSMDIVRYNASKKKIELILDIPPEYPRIAKFDPIRVKQILINLLNNAIKFTEEGEVELKIEFIDLGEGFGRYNFWVIDTGIGIKAEQLTKIFNAFSQADNSTTRKYGGTGLGLTISKLLAEKMGGTISVESEFGVGSKFRFSVETSYKKDFKERISENNQIKRVLVVDDNEKNLEIIKKHLKYFGIYSEGMSNGFDALKILKTKDFDMIIVDYQMPGINGIELIQSMISDLGKKEILVVLLYNPSDGPDVQNYFSEMGLKFNISKPVKMDELYSIIENCNKLENRISKIQPNILNSNKVKNTTSNDLSQILDKNKVNVLVAEDVSINMKLIKSLIKSIVPNVEILEACNGLQAVEIFSKNKVDIILMDIQMPEIDGQEATRRIRKYEKSLNIHTPIIALTAGAMDEEREKAFECGMDDFLTKPIKIEKLSETIKKYV